MNGTRKERKDYKTKKVELEGVGKAEKFGQVIGKRKRSGSSVNL